ncbi:MAG: hypothetical protein LC776_08285 [Acidobacteria bacterium]|nr:hypothetical protein [Acidobacteriota bacterium]
MISDFFVFHWKLTVVILGVCAATSLCLIARLWIRGRRGGTLRKLAWSLVLLVPLVGWIFFAGFYRPPEADENEGHVEYGGSAAGGGDFGPGGFGHH